MTPPTKRQLVPFGKYLLLDRVNIGGMAEVWRGKSFTPVGQERIVAVKRILPNIAEDEDFIAMFMDEARISVQLAHSSIAQILDFDFERTHNSYYLVMEYIPGKDLRALFDRCRKLGEPAPAEVVAYIVSKVCDALDYAHRKRDATGREMNIVHRDVSPQNVLLSYSGEVKVIDFGIAKAAGKATRTQAGILKGKFAYMSPEQIRGQGLDRRSDIFAIGICLFELLSGQRLFTGDSDYSVLEKVRKAEIPPMAELKVNVAQGLERIVRKALARELDTRYQHASEMSEDLQRYLGTLETPFGRKDLAQYMKSVFPEDVEKERLRDLEYAEIHGPIPPAALAPQRRPSQEAFRAVSTLPVPAGGGTHLAPGLAPLPTLKPRTGGGPNALDALADALPSQAPSGDEESKTVMQGDAGDLLREVRADVARKSRPDVPALRDEDEGAPFNTLWDKGGAHPGDPFPPEPTTREDRIPRIDRDSGSMAAKAISHPGMLPDDTSVGPDPAAQSAAHYLSAVGPGDEERGALPRDTAETHLAKPSLGGGTGVTRASRPALVPPGQFIVSLRTVRLVAALGIAAFVLSMGLVATSGFRKASYLYVDVPEELHDTARVQINSENLGHPKQWPVEYPTRKGPAVVLVTADGYRPFREDVDVKGRAKMVQAQLVPVQEFTKLIVITDPSDAEIYLDGKLVRRPGERGIYAGDLPVREKKLLEVRSAGHHSFAKAVEGTSAQQIVTVDARLEPEDYPVRILSHPAGAQVFANGRMVGTTPLTLRTNGDGQVTLRRRCYAEAQAALPPPSASAVPAQLPVDLRHLPGCH